MEYCHEVMFYIMESEPLSSVELAEHFEWSNTARRQWITALRAWGWIASKGRIESTEEGRKEAKNEVVQ